jgi:hypothetical protein
VLCYGQGIGSCAAVSEKVRQLSINCQWKKSVMWVNIIYRYRDLAYAEEQEGCHDDDDDHNHKKMESLIKTEPF